eukprot:SAG31_NODE_6657_length_1935_cov_1.657407_2_plen_132_part_00
MVDLIAKVHSVRPPQHDTGTEFRRPSLPMTVRLPQIGRSRSVADTRGRGGRAEQEVLPERSKSVTSLRRKRSTRSTRATVASGSSRTAIDNRYSLESSATYVPAHTTMVWAAEGPAAPEPDHMAREGLGVV